VVGKINDGLRTSRFALVCLSKNFLRRPWPETEMAAVLAIQSDQRVKRVLPLILNSRDEELANYPLLAGLAYREFAGDADKLAEENAALTRTEPRETATPDEISVTVEGVHTGKLCRLRASKRTTVKWLANKAQAGLEVMQVLPAGPFTEFRIRWVLVDVKAEDEWEALPRSSKRELHALVASEEGVRVARDDRERLETLQVKDGTVFHLYAIEDEGHPPQPAAM